MKKKSKIIILIIVAIISVFMIAFAYWALVIGYGGLVDYWATYDEFESIVKDGSNRIIFAMPGVSGWPETNVAFTDCAFSFEVNGTSLPPVNLNLNSYNSMSGPYWQAYAQISRGDGTFNSIAFFQGNISYIVTFIDSDDNGYVTSGDFVTVESTKPLVAGADYRLDVFVDIDGTWGVGRVYGTLQN